MRLSHINIVARDVERLAEFYRQVFGCRDLRASRTLSGAAMDRGMGLSRVQIRSVWLSMPGCDEVFLELFQFASPGDRTGDHANTPGYAHMAFDVSDLVATCDAILRAGGFALGEVTNLGTDENPSLAVYMRDPEGSISSSLRNTSRESLRLRGAPARRQFF
ncbi:VOC family protein [Tropicibacter sp. Alg240-R139]|uniref:VOC family protein n=1 Tax=Tropicibacter sp. Alg240-R139 TaxID=2305991 RepID=UPI002102A65C|nr:VOC family protein [Tropicibacter sp. Alg240-R139]